MTDESREELEQLLPWLANGTLTDTERERLEAALRQDEALKRKLDDHLAMAALGDEGVVETSMREISPELLVDYVERPESISDEGREWIESRIERDPVAREALNGLLRTEHALRAQAAHAEATRERSEAGAAAADAARVEPTTRREVAPWRRLLASLLSPAPALAYLLIAAIGLPVLWSTSRDGLPAAGGLTPLTLSGERNVRGSSSEAAIDVAVPTRFAQLSLETGLPVEDLAGVELEFVLRREGDELLRERIDATSRRDVAGRVVIDVVVDIERLPHGRELTAALVARAAGHPLDGADVFRRDLRFLTEVTR